MISNLKGMRANEPHAHLLYVPAPDGCVGFENVTKVENGDRTTRCSGMWARFKR